MLKFGQRSVLSNQENTPKSSDPTLERSFRGHKGCITGLSFKPAMTQIATSSEDNTVMVWNFKPQLRAYRFVGHKAQVTSVDFAPNGNLLASCSRDKTVRLWTPTVKGDVTVFQAHTSAVRCVQFSNDSQILLSASEDKSIKLWSTHKTKFNGTLVGHANWVRSAKFSPDSRLIVSGSDDRTVRLWDLRTKKTIKVFNDHNGHVQSVAFHPSGTVFASGSADKSIKLFDLRTNSLIQHYSDAHQAAKTNPSLDGVNSISFGGSAGEWLISTGHDGLVKIWDIKEGHLHFTLHAHKDGPTTCAQFSPDNGFFATGGSDSVIMVWKANFTDSSSFENEQETEFVDKSIREKDIVAEAEKSEIIEVQPATNEKQAPPFEDKKPNVSHTEHDIKENIATERLLDQIGIMAQTMAIMEDRLTMNEDRVEGLDQKLSLILEKLDQLKR